MAVARADLGAMNVPALALAPTSCPHALGKRVCTSGGTTAGQGASAACLLGEQVKEQDGGKSRKAPKQRKAHAYETTTRVAAPLPRGGRVIQFSSVIPIMYKAAVGWAAKRRQAAAMLV